MLIPSCSFSEDGSSQYYVRAKKDYSLDQLDQLLPIIDKAPSSLSSDSEIRCSLFFQNRISVLTILLHSFIFSLSYSLTKIC